MAVLNRYMDRLTTAELADTLETLRRNVRDLLFRTELVSVGVESTIRHQVENRRQCIQILQELEAVTETYKIFLQHIESRAYEKEGHAGNS